MFRISYNFTLRGSAHPCSGIRGFLMLGVVLLLLQPACANEVPIDTSLELVGNPLVTQAYNALEMGQTADALAMFEQISESEAGNVPALLGRALIYSQQERHAQAFSAYDQILLHHPSHAFAWNGRGLAAFNLEDFDEALSSFKRATQDQPVNGFFYESLAWTQMCRGEFSDAAESAKTSMLMYTRNGEKAVYPLLIAYFSYLESGDIENARRTLNYAQNNYDPNLWPAPIVDYLAGKINQSDLVSFVMDSTEETEAHTYIGLKMRSEKQLAAADLHLNWVSRNGDSRVFEYTLARAIQFRSSVAELSH